jgi:hypothetical protein
VHIASKTPTGYQRRDDGRLEPHPDHAEHVTNVFRLRAGGASWRDLAAYLNEHDVVGPYGSPHWRTRAVTHMIRNRVYLGEARSGEHVNAHAHPPLIDARTWERAQETRAAPPASKNEPALLSGLIRCAGCRYLLKPDRMSSRGSEPLRMYRCRGEHAAGRCPDRSAVLARVIEPYVVARFFARVRIEVADPAARGVDLADLEQAAVAAETEYVTFRDNESLVELGDAYVDGLRARAGRYERAERALSDARADLAEPDVPDVDTLEEVWDDMPTVERQKLLGGAIGAVMLRSGRSLAIEDRVVILAPDEVPESFPRRGKRVPFGPFPWPDGPDGVGVASV